MSRLTVALESLNASGQDGHIIARSDSKSYPRRGGQLDASISASSASLSAQQQAHPHHHASDLNRLVTHAKRLSKPAADMVGLNATHHGTTLVTNTVETACRVLRMVGDLISLHWARTVSRCLWDGKGDEDVSGLY